jgi:hypothetical protein
MKALSLQTGDSVSAVCECQDVASCPFRPSKGRKSRALPHPGPLALQLLRSGCKASTNLMAKNYTNIKRGLTHREIPEEVKREIVTYKCSKLSCYGFGLSTLITYTRSVLMGIVRFSHIFRKITVTDL